MRYCCTRMATVGVKGLIHQERVESSTGREGLQHLCTCRTSHSAHPDIHPPSIPRRPEAMQSPGQMQRYGAPRDRQRQLVAVHRIPDNTQLLVASDAWDAASRLSRSRRVLAAESPALQPQYDSRDGRMRVMDETSAGEEMMGSGPRRMSNTGSQLGDWINKYQKSGHHADRLVRTIVQYEQTTGQPFPGTTAVVYCNVTINK